jgi:UDP-N-acetylglucosamine 4,6-dehydratase/5-epimerase
MNLLIIGITGFLGRNLANYFIRNSLGNLTGIYSDPNKAYHFNKSFPNVQLYQVDITSNNLEIAMNQIIAINKITHIINCAAIKYINVCTQQPLQALRINTIASNNIVKISRKNNINHFMTISSDKISCNNIYGISKYLMEEYTIACNYTVYRGVNFFWSDNSVLDIWYHAYQSREDLILKNPNQVRYFNVVDQIMVDIFDNIYRDGIILPRQVYEVKLQDLFDAFAEYFNYYRCQIITENECEIDTNKIASVTIPLGKDELKQLIHDHCPTI